MEIELDNLPEPVLRRANEICNKFEEDWKRGARPNLCEFLNQTNLNRDVLLPLLLPLEIDYRRLAGESPTPEDYFGKFPEDVASIRVIFEKYDPQESHSIGTAVTVSQEVSESPGTLIGPYKLREKIGEGGMGVVYLAEQTLPVRRRVALKIIKPGMDSNEVIKRFDAERQALALMDHHNIARVLDAGATESGRPYFVMELVRGIPITEYCDQCHLTTRERLKLFIPVCQAIQHAHHKGIIHRDVKPTNVLVAIQDGQPVPKVIDFGVAKAINQRLTEQTIMTGFAQMIGTPLYMSPEQAEMSPLDVDTRSDIYSLGVLLYELLTGTTPLRKERLTEVGYDELRRIIREEDPAKPSTRISTLGANLTTVAEHRRSDPRKLKQLVRGDLDWIVMNALEKDRTRRYETASALAADVQRFLADEPIEARGPSILYRLRKYFRRKKPVAVATSAILIAVALASIFALRFLHSEKQLGEVRTEVAHARQSQQNEQGARQEEQRVRQQVIPEIEALIKAQQYHRAFRLAQQARRILPDDPTLAELFQRTSETTSIITNPGGATISIRDYGSHNSGWEYVGESPLQNHTHPRGLICWKAEKKGLATTFRLGPSGKTLNIELLRSEDIPNNMVHVPAGPSQTRLYRATVPNSLQLQAFFIDRLETTNREFKQFVDQRGYRNPAFWKHPFRKDGEEITWEQAIAQFVDSTGWPGPSTWRLGEYKEGEDDFPVQGVSWYEAAAYAAFVGKNLPTIYHWSRAAGVKYAEQIVPLSNFSGLALAPVGRRQSLGPYGTFDLAGNVKEWCWNSTVDDQRLILGGAWNEPEYMFNDLDSRTVWDRSEQNGFRCVKYLSEISAVATADIPPLQRDYSREQPVGESEYVIYKRMYAYDRDDLHAEVISVDTGDVDFIHETIAIDAAYGDERVTLHLYLPRHVSPPFQTIVYVPGSDSIYRKSFDPGTQPRFLVRSGRAVMVSVLKGTFGERGHELRESRRRGMAAHQASIFYRDKNIHWSKDLGRSLDYLQTRTDIDHQNLGFFGFSLGAALGPIFLAVDERLKAAVLVGGGFYPAATYPETAQINFAPRVSAPVLMINGEGDTFFPLESSQRPMFRLLGSASTKKRHQLFRGGHSVIAAHQTKVFSTTADWFDEYLGVVERINAAKQLADYTKAIEAAGDKATAEMFTMRGRMLRDHFGDYDKALADFSKSIELLNRQIAYSSNEQIESDLIRALETRYSLHLKLRRFDEVAADLERIGELSPNQRAELNKLKAHLLGRQGRWREAAELMREALLNSGGTASNWLQLLYVWLFLDDGERINETCDELLRRFGDTEDPVVAHAVATGCLLAPDRKVTDHVRHLTNLSGTATGRYPFYHRDLALLHYRQGDLESAEKRLGMAKRSAGPSGNAISFYFLAIVRHKRGDTAGAREALREANRYREHLRSQISGHDYGENWCPWLLVEAVRREAGKLLGTKDGEEPN